MLWIHIPLFVFTQKIIPSYTRGRHKVGLFYRVVEKLKVMNALDPYTTLYSKRIPKPLSPSMKLRLEDRDSVCDYFYPPPIFYDKINSESCLQHQPESYVVNLP